MVIKMLINIDLQFGIDTNQETTWIVVVLHEIDDLGECGNLEKVVVQVRTTSGALCKNKTS